MTTRRFRPSVLPARLSPTCLLVFVFAVFFLALGIRAASPTAAAGFVGSREGTQVAKLPAGVGDV